MGYWPNIAIIQDQRMGMMLERVEAEDSYYGEPGSIDSRMTILGEQMTVFGRFGFRGNGRD